MNHPIETKVAAGGIVGLLLALLTVYVPAIHAHVSPALAATLPVILGAFAAYMAPHTTRPTDSGTLVTDIITGIDRLLSSRAGRVPVAQPPPATVATLAVAPPVPAGQAVQGGPPQ